MNLSLSKSELKEYIARQLEKFFPDKYKFQGSDIDIAFDAALQRTEYCFKYVNLPHYTRENQIWFNHLHSDQYSTFLYFLSNELWGKSENKPICDKLMLLNRALNSLFISYKCNMPNVFLLSHPVGTVIGNAEIQEFFVVVQNVTINTADSSGRGPKIGKGVVLGAGSVILGNSKIGNRTSIGVNTIVRNTNIPSDSVVFTDSQGVMLIKANKKECAAQKLFNVVIND